VSSDNARNPRPWLPTWQTVELLIAQGPFRHAIPAGKSAILSYDGQRLAITVSLGPDEDPARLPALPQALRFDIDVRSRALTVTCTEPELHKYFYTYACHALEFIREGQQLAVAAFREAWVRTRELIEQQVVLSRDKQLGLLGELILLANVAATHHLGWRAALESWHRAANAEHDFAFRSADIEVKTTSKETRAHIIGSLNQLKASPGRSLYLLSLQFSASPLHANGSISLNEKITEIRNAFGTTDDLRTQFLQRLTSAGWNEEHSSHYNYRVIERSHPTIIKVDDEFPRLTPENLVGLRPDHLVRIQSVVYSVDVSGLGEALTPRLLAELIS